jgi:hypothetical protein
MTKPNSILILVAILACPSISGAANISSDSPSSVVKTLSEHGELPGTPLTQEIVVSVDVTGIMSCDAEGSLLNTKLPVDLFDLLGITDPTPNDSVVLTGIGWNVTQTSGLDAAGNSWLSEMTIGIDYENDGTNDLYLTPSNSDMVGTESNDSQGIIDLVTAGQANGTSPTGIVTIEFFESFDDEANACEGIYDSGSLMLDVTPVPEPALSIWPLLALSLLLRRSRS